MLTPILMGSSAKVTDALAELRYEIARLTGKELVPSHLRCSGISIWGKALLHCACSAQVLSRCRVAGITLSDAQECSRQKKMSNFASDSIEGNTDRLTIRTLGTLHHRKEQLLVIKRRARPHIVTFSVT